ncbi:aldo/keto reductase [Baekduia sp. Peel2402]|uniref:aldo/keto reductase n=1 Tax=Baekduia sp. Peel2402 TaxID=3458296 RepID=UPI00403E7AD4
MSAIPSVDLGGDVTIPQLGFGVFQIPDDDTERAVTQALELGYRHIDTAAIYRNEKGVGRALAASGLARDEVFVTTKLWNDAQGRESAPGALADSLSRLGLEYVDLYLIHWPSAKQGLYVETWEALLELQQEGLSRAVGVSNFQIPHLEAIIEATGVSPSINQVELHPWLAQGELRAFHAQAQIATEAWSPLAQGGSFLSDTTLAGIAGAHGKSVAQVILRWHVQLGNVAIPKSATPSRIAENAQVFDFELSAGEMDAIAGLDRGERVGPDPDRFG